jgi:hypothetical protein
LTGHIVPHRGEDEPEKLPRDSHQGFGLLHSVDLGEPNLDSSEGPLGLDGPQGGKEEALAQKRASPSGKVPPSLTATRTDFKEI